MHDMILCLACDIINFYEKATMPFTSHPLKFFDKNTLTARRQQQDVLNRVYDGYTSHDYFILDLPTGVGKTYIGCAIAAMVKGGAYVLTSTLQLQDQYQISWDELVNLKGRSNYECALNSAFTVDAAPCTANKQLMQDCMSAKCCNYYNQRDKALASHAMITNPLFLLYSAHCGFAKDDDKNPWVKREVMIIDEAHNLENHLVSFASSEIDPKKLGEEYGAKIAKLKFTGEIPDDYQVLKEILVHLTQKAEELAEQLKREFGTVGSGNPKEWAKQFKDSQADKAKKLNQRIYALDKEIQPLNIFFNTHSTPEELMNRWLMHVNPETGSMTLSPVYANFLFHAYLGHLADKFIFMSATPGSKRELCHELGLREDRVLYVTADTPFPAEKSPIMVMPMLNLTYSQKQNSIPKLGGVIDAILQEHKGERGIIHCASYAFGSEIFKRVSPDIQKRLLFKDMDTLIAARTGKPVKYSRGYNNAELLAKHELSHDTVLISPSMMEGVDLYDDLSAFQIILKMPWASLSDPRVVRKKDLNQGWYTNQVWKHIMQASGRSTRHENDSSVTYVLDDSFPKHFRAWKNNLPKWFTDRVVQ
jgi:Rad3-related DNA helicase